MHVIMLHKTKVNILINLKDHKKKFKSPNAAQIFDYIIVGAGAAGSLLAYRLAQADQSKKVLLIEAGKEPVIDTVVRKIVNENFSVMNFYIFW